MPEVSKTSISNGIKLYFFPSLVSILAMMIWRDVTELRSDVKQLLAESASNKTKVERLERQVEQLNQAVFRIPKTAGNNSPNDKRENFNQTYAVLNKNEYTAVKKEPPYKTN